MTFLCNTFSFLDYVPLKSRRSRWDSTERSEPRAKVKTVTDRVRIIDDDGIASTPGTSKLSAEDEASEELIKKIDSMPPVPTSSFKPFATDSEKQSRYERFLMFRKFGLRGLMLLQLYEYIANLVLFYTIRIFNTQKINKQIFSYLFGIINLFWVIDVFLFSLGI